MVEVEVWCEEGSGRDKNKYKCRCVSNNPESSHSIFSTQIKIRNYKL